MSEQEFNIVFSSNLKRLMEERNMTQLELAESIGATQQAVSHWISGDRSPRMKYVDKLCGLFGVSRSDLISEDKDIGYDGIGQIKKIMLPVLGSVSCGLPKYAEEKRGLYVSADLDVDADFVLIASGDSMINAGIKDGSYVLCKRCDMVENGQIACIVLGDDALLKRIYYYPENGLLLLHAENPAYRDITLTGEDLNSVTIIGRAVMYQGMVE